MESGIVRLKWEVDSAGYDLVEREEEASTVLTRTPAGTHIVARGGRPRFYDVGLREHDIFLALANTPGTSEGALAFTRKWGLLHKGNQLLSAFVEIRDSMAWSLTKTNPSVGRALKNHGYGSLGIAIEKNRVVFRARALLQFCWLERFQALQGGVDVSRCAGCGVFLPVHKEGRPKKHCSNACKQAVYRKNNEQQRRTTRRAAGLRSSPARAPR